MTKAEEELLIAAAMTGKREEWNNARLRVAKERTPPEFFEQCVAAYERIRIAELQAALAELDEIIALARTTIKVVAAAEARVK